MNKNYKKIYDQSIKNPEEFWQKVSDDIFWFKKPTKILNKSISAEQRATGLRGQTDQDRPKQILSKPLQTRTECSLLQL